MYGQGQKNKINMHKKATMTQYSTMSILTWIIQDADQIFHSHTWFSNTDKI